jgi:hypothetical protein
MYTIKKSERHSEKLKLIKVIKLKYLYAKSKREQDFYAQVLEKIDFF